MNVELMNRTLHVVHITYGAGVPLKKKKMKKASVNCVTARRFSHVMNGKLAVSSSL